MKFGIDWTQRTTKLGALVISGVAISLLFLTFSSVEKAMAVMGIMTSAAGLLGVAVKD